MERIKEMNPGIVNLQEYRNFEGARIYNNNGVKRIGATSFQVKSQSLDNEYYEIEAVGANFNCSCPDYQQRSKFLTCKHIVATELYLKNEADCILIPDQ